MWSKCKPYVLNLFLSSSIFIAIALIIGFIPFGENTMLTIDLGQQYIDFYSLFRDTIFNDSSQLFYSFEKAIGGEMLGLWAYYLLSPFNFIFLLFSESNLALAVTLITYLKLISASTAFMFLIRRKYKIETIPALIFSQSYTFMSYTMVYLLNIMWLDGLVLLPLIILGLDNIVNRKSNKLYVFSLAILLIANYYIGYMVCLFLAFYTFYSIIENQDKFSFKNLCVNYLIFLKNSIIATLLAGVVLLPTFYSLTQNKGSYMKYEINWNTVHSIKDVASKFFIGSFNFDEMSSGSPNLYAGMFILLLVFLYYFNSKIKLSEKITSLMIFAMFFVSFYFEIFDKLWHGGQFPIWYHFRFSFVASFFFIMLAVKAFKKQPRYYPTYQLILATVAIVAFSMYYYVYNEYDFLNAINIFVSLIVFLGLLIVLQLDFLYKSFRYILLLAVVTVELTANASLILSDLNYVADSKFNDYVATLDESLTHLRHDETEFYRINKTYQRTKDEAMYAHYNGLDHFGSTIEAHVPELFGYLGLPDGNGFVTYTNGTLFTDDFFNVKYHLEPTEDSSDHTLDHEYVLYPRATDLDNQAYPIAQQTPRYLIRENEQRLGLGIEVSTDIATEASTFVQHQPIYNQELLLKLIDFQGTGEAYFKEQTLAEPTYLNIDVSNVGDGDYYTYNKQIPDVNEQSEENPESYFEISFSTDSDNPYYFTLPSQFDDDNVSLSLNGQNYRFYTPYRRRQITNASFQTVSAYQTLKVKLLEDSLSANLISLYEFDQTRFDEMISSKQDHLFEVTHFKQNHIQGNITTQQDQAYLLFTIPFDPQWQITVDGKAVEPEPVLNETLMAIPLTAGYHEISLLYFPRSIWFGLAATMSGLILLLVNDRWLAHKSRK